MKRTFFIAQLVLCLSLFGEQPKLPTGVDELVTKLANWEKQQAASYEKLVADKRSAVAKALVPHMEKATKAGDLDGAVAIREVINSLLPKGESLENSGYVSKAPVAVDLTKFAGKWDWPHPKESLTIKDDGTGFQTAHGKFKIIRSGPEFIEVRFPDSRHENHRLGTTRIEIRDADKLLLLREYNKNKAKYVMSRI